MRLLGRVPKAGAASVRWLLEGVLIVISVLLAFGVEEYRESRANRELATRVLTGLQTEIGHNLATLEPYLAKHRRWMGALNKWLQTDRTTTLARSGATGLNVFIATWPDFDANNIKPAFPILRRGAWEAALSTSALRLVDYDVAAKLSEIYEWQRSLAAAIEGLPYSSTSFFDPVNSVASVQHLAFQINAIELTEQFLLEAYRQHLPAIRAAAYADS
jgi:hypothetical protein